MFCVKLPNGMIHWELVRKERERDRERKRKRERDRER